MDSFDDLTQARLPSSSREPTRYQRGYRDGQYVIVKSDPVWDFTPTAELPGTYTDATLSVEARLVGEQQDRYIILACRASKASDSHYRFGIQPGPGRFELSRWDGGDRTPLVAWRSSPAIKRGTEWNQLELSCQGSTIRAVANGVEVAKVDDATYARGELWIGAGAFAEARVTAEARFDNLVVTAP
jgi:hypothetical protein